MTEPAQQDTQRTRPVKYIFVTGGVVSSLGKGLAAASIGALLEGHGKSLLAPLAAFGDADYIDATRLQIIDDGLIEFIGPASSHRDLLQS